MKRRTLTWIILAAFVLALVLGGVILACTQQAGATLSYHGRHIAKDVYAYWQVRFAFAYRTMYGGGASDTPAFWQSVADPESGKTHAEACEDYIKKMVGQIVIAAGLFDESGYTLTAGQRQALATSLENATGGYRFGGDTEAYELLAKANGFTKKSVQTALLYEMKANLFTRLAQADDAQLIAYYQETFVRVRILYVNNYCLYLTDAVTGDRLQDENGNDRYRLLNEEEIAAKNAIIATIKAELQAFEGSQMPTADKHKAFEELMGKYNEDIAVLSYPSGYYFGKNADFTADFRKGLPLVTDMVFELTEAGDIAAVVDERGVYFVMRYALDATALANKANEVFFSDLATDASGEYLMAWIGTYEADLIWRGDTALPDWEQRNDLYKLIVNPPSV